MNNVCLIGRITKNPELKYIDSSTPVVNFILAVQREYVKRSTMEFDEPDFILCVVFRKQAENLNRYVKKGALLSVQGRIKVRLVETSAGPVHLSEIICETVRYLESTKAPPESNHKETEILNNHEYEIEKLPF